MAEIRLSCVLLAVALLLGVAACGAVKAVPGPESATNSPGSASDTAGDGRWAGLPQPSTLRQPSVVSSGVFRFGNQYETPWPAQLVEPNGTRLRYTPEWQDSGLDGAAYAIYAFDTTGFTMDTSLRLDWQKHSLGYGTLWIGLANFTLDRWDWFRGPETGILTYNRLKYSQANKVYAAVVCLGAQEWELKSIRVCPGFPPIVQRILPRYVNQGVATTISAELEGFANSYAWDFGGGGTPNSSTALAPGIMPGAVGEYAARVTVANGYGKDVYDFTLHVLPPPGQGAWSMYGHDNRHTHRSPYLGAQTDNLRWQLETTDGIYCSPSIGADGTVYIGSNDNYLYALYPDGTVRWRYPTGDWIWSSPTIGPDGTVYFGSFDNKLYAVHYSGALLWAYPTGDWVRSAPAIGADGTVYFGSRDGRVYALTPAGEKLWTYTTNDAVDSSPALAEDGTIYVGSDDFNLYAINPDGSLQWKFPTGDMVWSSPAIAADGTVYFGSYDNKLYAVNRDGSQQWAYTAGFKVGSSPAIGMDGAVYFGSYDGKLYALNPDGTLRWSYNCGSSVRSSPALDAQGTVYFGCDDNQLYALNADGTLKWQYATGWYAFASPAIGEDGAIYIASYDGKVYAFGQ